MISMKKQGIHLFTVFSMLGIGSTACVENVEHPMHTSDSGDSDDGGVTPRDAGMSSSNGDAAFESGASDANARTSGEGVLPGESGLEASCRRYRECGGTYYASAEACVTSSLEYWGECATVRSALDAFGSCMALVPCEDYSPDAYNPASTVCADQWAALRSTPECQ